MQPPDFEEPLDPIDSYSMKLWAQVPELIRKDVEQHVLANLSADLLAKLRPVCDCQILSALRPRQQRECDAAYR